MCNNDILPGFAQEIFRWQMMLAITWICFTVDVFSAYVAYALACLRHGDKAIEADRFHF